MLILREYNDDDFGEIAQIYGMLIDSARRIGHKFWNAVIFNPAFSLTLPHTLEELEANASAFEEKSKAFGLYKGVIGALDGWLCDTNKPIVHNTSNFFSGHYQRFGLNVQAMCDAHLHFMFLGITGLGDINNVLLGFGICPGFGSRQVHGTIQGSKCQYYRQPLEEATTSLFVVGTTAVIIKMSTYQKANSK
jgi:hypothetical protein